MHRIINPCESVVVDGTVYRINTDFSVWIEIEELFVQNKSFHETAAKILALAYPVLPSSPLAAFEKILWFYAGGEEMSEPEDSSVCRAPTMNMKKDFQYIWAAFLGEFGIDLSMQKLHWWKFRALMLALGDECKFSKIVSYRSMNVSGIKDRNMRSFYEKMKEKYRLDDFRTPDERERETVLMLDSLF